jgi:hypothetical protein
MTVWGLGASSTDPPDLVLETGITVFLVEIKQPS